MSSLIQHSDSLSVHDGTLEVHLLGLVDFDAMIGLQEHQIYDLSGQSGKNGRLFLCEHPITISFGRQASRADLHLDDDELNRRGIPVRWVARGGGALCHAPGQLAIYLQLPLRDLEVGIAEFREIFERSVQAACREVRIPVKRRTDETGVWSRIGQVAHFGAAVKSWISCHGMFLNVSVDPRVLEFTTANGLGVRSTSLQSQRLQPVRMAFVREALIRHLSQNFGYETVDLFTGHPLLKRTTQRVCIHA